MPSAAHPIDEHHVSDRIHQITEDVYRLELPTPFPVGDVNVFFLDGPDPVLIDTGVATEESLQALEENLETLHRSIADIRTLLITHVHVDHAGAARWIQQRSGCPVYMHPRGHRVLNPSADQEERDRAWMREYYMRSGLLDKAAQKAWDSMRLARSLMQFGVDLLPVSEGAVLDLGEHQFRVMECFGHTTNHVAYEHTAAKLLFTADHLLPDITANPTLEVPLPEDTAPLNPLALYQESLRKTAQTRAGIACPGHGRPFTNIEARCQEIQSHQVSRCEDVFTALAQTPGASRKELSEAIFGAVRSIDVYLTLSEITAALQYLLELRRIRKIDDSDVDRYETLG
ncbi:MAG: hypothetical protein CMH54_15615 [Myxococcales bacterium]|nr:hypothetical protein [Myxococcales bacterium]